MECSPFFFGLRALRDQYERTPMIELMKSYHTDEDGAVTVDWVVLTAAVVGLAIASFASIQTGSQSVGNKVGEYLTDTPVETVMGIGG